MKILFSIQMPRGLSTVALYKIYIHKSPDDKICGAKLLIRRGPDRHQASAEILLLERDLKTFSNHCRCVFDKCC